MVSSTTSENSPVRLGMNVWCHSSKLATNAVPATAIQVARHRQPRSVSSACDPNVSKQALSHANPSNPYPVKCPDFRMKWWIKPQSVSLICPRNRSTKGRIQPLVLFDEKVLVDSIAITIIMNTTGHQTRIFPQRPSVYRRNSAGSGLPTKTDRILLNYQPCGRSQSPEKCPAVP